MAYTALREEEAELAQVARDPLLTLFAGGAIETAALWKRRLCRPFVCQQMNDPSKLAILDTQVGVVVD
jgi:hypothetical protein